MQISQQIQTDEPPQPYSVSTHTVTFSDCMITRKTVTSGNHVMKGEYMNGTLAHGLFKDYKVNEDGQRELTYQGIFDHGKRIGAHNFFENGKIVRTFDADKQEQIVSGQQVSRL